MAMQLQQPNTEPQSADQMLQNLQSSFAESRPSYRQSSAAAAYPRAGNQQGSPLVPRTPPASLASTPHPTASLPLNSTASAQRASATAAAAAAARSRQSSLLNGTAAGQPPLQRTSMLVQLQQPTAQGGSVVQPVRHAHKIYSLSASLLSLSLEAVSGTVCRLTSLQLQRCFSESPESLAFSPIFSLLTIFGFQF